MLTSHDPAKTIGCWPDAMACRTTCASRLQTASEALTLSRNGVSRSTSANVAETPFALRSRRARHVGQEPGNRAEQIR
jgi:hypothetical protein